MGEHIGPSADCHGEGGAGVCAGDANGGEGEALSAVDGSGGEIEGMGGDRGRERRLGWFFHNELYMCIII